MGRDYILELLQRMHLPFLAHHSLAPATGGPDWVHRQSGAFRGEAVVSLVDQKYILNGLALLDFWRYRNISEGQ